MRFPDINVWLALTFQSHAGHPAAKRWFESIEFETVVFCRQTQQGFLWLATNEKAFGEDAVTMSEAWRLYETIFSDPRLAFFPEPERIDGTWKSLTDRETRSPKLWNDAWLAGFAIRHSLELVTFDKEFAQFEGLRYLILGLEEDGLA